MVVRRNLFPSISSTPSKRARTLATTATVSKMMRNRMETKYFILNGPFNPGAGNSTQIIPVSQIDGGNAADDRSGNEVIATRLQVRLFPVTSLTTPFMVRIIAPRDPSLVPSGTLQWSGLQRDQYVELYSKLYSPMSDGATSNRTGCNIDLRLNRKLKWSAAAGTTYVKSPIYVLVTYPVNGVITEGYCTLQFKDA